MSDWRDEYFVMLRDCSRRASRLNDREKVFIDSVNNQLIAGKILTAKQIEKLSDIWEKATEKY